MRILIIHNYYQHKGGEDVVFQQEYDLLRKEHEVYTLTFQNKKGLKGLIQYLLYPWNIFAYRKVQKYIKKINPDIVHVHNTHYGSGPVVIQAAKKLQKPVVLSLHNFRLLCPSATLFYNGKIFLDSITQKFPWTAVRNKVLDNSLAKTFLTAFTYYIHQKLKTWQKVDLYLPLANFSKDLLLTSKRNIKAEQITVKPNFITITAKVRIAEDFYLYVGRLSLEKGIIELIRAFKKSGKQLIIVGSGPLKDQIKNDVENEANIHLVGELNKCQIIDKLAQCKALIVPSVCYEGGVPLTIIEALACKTPVLASKIGAIADEIKDDSTGWTFNPFNPDSINSAIEKFESTSAIVINEITDRAHERYKQHYTKDNVLHILINQYKKLTENE